MKRPALLSLLLLALGACDDGSETQDQDVIVRTESEAEWAQYVANVRFAEGYTASCKRDPESTRPHVLVTGFGRFLENKENATGRMVSALVPGLEYPLTEAPAKGEVDEPAPQLRVAQAVIDIEGVGEVEVCGMVLPVFWDLASILVIKESQAFEPDFVLMNGIAGGRQPLWIELGSVNAAVSLPDGSGLLAPVQAGSKLLEEAPDEERERGLLLSWSSVRAAVEEGRLALAAEEDENGVAFGDILQGVLLAGYPRASNTYLCNNTTYVVNYLYDHPYETFRVLQPSHPRPNGPTGVDLALDKNLFRSPRVFMHWAKELSGSHLERGAALMKHIIGAQLSAVEEPSRGNPELAEF